MRIQFDNELKNLNDKLIQMGNAIEKNISESFKALVNKDVELATRIANEDSLIDRMQREIENICFDLLIREQPVAKDLRAVTAALKMVTDMERIGDHAADISEITIIIAENKLIINSDIISLMASETIDMLIKSIDAFTEKSADLANWVIEHDDVVDQLFLDVKADIVELIKKDSHRGEAEIDMLLIAKYLERIADHATNIAEWVLYSLDNRIKG